MLIFSRLSHAFWVLMIIIGLSSCSTLNQSFEALKELTSTSDEGNLTSSTEEVAIATDEQGLLPIEPRPVAIDQYKISRQILTDQQQTMVSSVYRFTSTKQPINNAAQLKANLDAIETHIASIGSIAIPSMLFLALGDGYMQLQQTDNAISAWQQSVRVNDHNYFAHDRLAQAYRQKGDFQSAEQHYTDALEAWPDFIIGYRNRGILYDLYMGDKPRALNDYQHYKQLLTLAGNSTREVDRWIKEMQRAIN